MPGPKTTRKTSTSTTVSSQPSLKASFAAARNAKSAVVGDKKTVVVAPTVVILATPSPVETAPTAVPKKVFKKRVSTTDDDSEEEEEDYEPISPIVESDDDDVVEVQVQEEKPQLNVKDKSVNGHLRKVNAKAGYLRGIHTEGETKFEKILRIFDLSYEYGPCVGLTRLERWNRAETLGLKPPVEVRDILLTEQGEEKLGENIFHRRV